MNKFENLVEILNGAAVQYSIIEHDDITNTKDGLKILQCEQTEAVKTLGFKIEGKYVFFAVRGDKRLDYKKVAALLNTSRKMISPITVKELENELNYEAGGLSPLHTDSSITVHFDKNILDIEVVYCGIGVKNKTLKIKSADLFLLSKSVLSNIVQC